MAIKFTLTIECDNAAFCADNDSVQENADARGEEIGRILERLMRKVSTHGAALRQEWTLCDSNGNRVGQARCSATRKRS